MVCVGALGRDLYKVTIVSRSLHHTAVPIKLSAVGGSELLHMMLVELAWARPLWHSHQCQERSQSLRKIMSALTLLTTGC